MARRPSQAALTRRLLSALKDAHDTMQDVAAVLDVTNIGRCKFRLIRASDRAATALQQAEQE